VAGVSVPYLTMQLSLDSTQRFHFCSLQLPATEQAGTVKPPYVRCILCIKSDTNFHSEAFQYPLMPSYCSFFSTHLTGDFM